MINVTHKLESVKHHRESGITWVKLAGDADFEWVTTQHPNTPSGFVAIGGTNNGSFRIAEKSALDKLVAK
jgi:hypothetical protein